MLCSGTGPARPIDREPITIVVAELKPAAAGDSVASGRRAGTGLPVSQQLVALHVPAYVFRFQKPAQPLVNHLPVEQVRFVDPPGTVTPHEPEQQNSRAVISIV